MIKRRRFLKTSGAVSVMSGITGTLPCSVTSNAAEGYMLPEEAGRHLRTFMQWPVSKRVHPDRVFLDMLQQAIADVANTISEFEPVIMLMDRKHERTARKKLSDKIEIWTIPTEDLWCRDSGPVFVKNIAGDLAVSHLNFNGWGGKQVHKHDGRIAGLIAERLGLPLLDNGLVGEAGGAESDGAGTLIAHESSWINTNRNKGSRDEISRFVLDAFGCKKLIWAPGVKGGDITDYHIDALARFVEPGKVLMQLPHKIYPDDPWSAAAFETCEILKSATDAAGRKLEITVLPEPENPRIKSLDFVASYVNYYVCNGAVIAAQFGDRFTDGQAGNVLSTLYPDREIVMLNVDPIGEVGGGIHCATQQQPA